MCECVCERYMKEIVSIAVCVGMCCCQARKKMATFGQRCEECVHIVVTV